jgi:tetratricopeptide (TPR) repeat protein
MERTDIVESILDRGPSDNTFLQGLMEMKRAGRVNEVIRHCFKGLAIHPDDIRLRGLLAECLLEAGFIGLAEQELQEVSAEIGRWVSVHKLLASLYIRQKRFAEATRLLEQYRVFHPEDPEAADLMDQARAFEGEPAAEALPEGEAVAPHGEIEPAPGEKLPERPEGPPETPTAPEPGPPADAEAEAPAPEGFEELATPTLAEIYAGQGRIQEATATYRKVLENNPDDDTSRARLAQLEEAMAAEAAGAARAEAARVETEKAVKVLEDWLARLQEMSRAP